LEAEAACEHDVERVERVEIGLGVVVVVAVEAAVLLRREESTAGFWIESRVC